MTQWSWNYLVVVIEVVLHAVFLLLDGQRDVLDEAVGALEAVRNLGVVVGERADGGLGDGDAGLRQERRLRWRLQQPLASEPMQSPRK